MSSARTAFLLALTAPDRRDGYDLSMLPQMDEADRRFAADALLERTRRGDPAAAFALGVLLHAEPAGADGVAEALREKASAALWVAARSPRPPLSLQGLRALALLGDGDALERLAGLLQEGERDARFAFVMDLARVPGTRPLELLYAALGDPDGLVRSRALESVIARFGLGALTMLPGPDGPAVALETPLMTLDMMLMADREPVWRRGVAEAQAVTRGLVEGGAPESLALVPVVRDPGFRHALSAAWFDDGPPPFSERPIARRLAESAGDERRYAEVFLALQLESEAPAVRARAREALDALGVTWVWAETEAPPPR